MSRKILIPVDESKESEAAFEHALEEYAEDTLVLAHVINPVSAFGHAEEEAFELEEYKGEEEHRHEEAEGLLSVYRERAESDDVAVETTVEVGEPARRILALADQESVDHVVMGSRGRSGVGRVLLGSVAETVTRRSPVPVTIVR
jgi:nucleotide-binding universal stress UspA family protein